MNEPTIDEMLEWLDKLHKFSRQFSLEDIAIKMAIRAILEQHRHQVVQSGLIFSKPYIRQRELEAIRAFVERVEKRWDEVSSIGSPEDLTYSDCVDAELAAMEKEK